MAQPEDPTDASSRRSTPKAPRKQPASSATVEPQNAIEFDVDSRRGARAGGTLGVEPAAGSVRVRAKKTSKDNAAARAGPSTREPHSESIPDSVRERFIQIGNNFFFPDGAEAFTDRGNRLTTRSENAVVIQSMVALAKARTKEAITVTGTDFFKREAWFAARLVGLAVRGYEPTALEQERLVRAIARRRSAEKVEASAGLGTTADRDKRNGTQPHESSRAARERGFQQRQFVVGRLVDHGPAHFEHKPNQPMSYYVRIETDQGDLERWGVDLERAFRQSLSRPGIGDEVGLRVVGRDAVTVRAPRYDAQGREIGHAERDTHRNQWIVERKDFLQRRLKMADVFRDSSVSAAEGVKRFPELEGSYLQLQIARVGAEQPIAQSEAREQFVNHLRAHLAKSIEYGQPLEPVRLKAREQLAPEHEREPERDYAPPTR